MFTTHQYIFAGIGSVVALGAFNTCIQLSFRKEDHPVPEHVLRELDPLQLEDHHPEEEEDQFFEAVPHPGALKEIDHAYFC